jgi:hypothetical protein
MGMSVSSRAPMVQMAQPMAVSRPPVAPQPAEQNVAAAAQQSSLNLQGYLGTLLNALA